jgi:uncharacterized protein (DUF1778 family)
MAADDPKETLTIRLPKGLKELVDRAAQDRETTVTNLVRTALQETLHPVGRTYQQPGFSKEFGDFLDKTIAESKRVVLLVADEDSRRRYFVSGVFVAAFCNESLVAVGTGQAPSWIIPRRDVVAWYEGALHRELATELARRGWAERSAAPDRQAPARQLTSAVVASLPDRGASRSVFGPSRRTRAV